MVTDPKSGRPIEQNTQGLTNNPAIINAGIVDESSPTPELVAALEEQKRQRAVLLQQVQTERQRADEAALKAKTEKEKREQAEKEKKEKEENNSEEGKSWLLGGLALLMLGGAKKKDDPNLPPNRRLWRHRVSRRLRKFGESVKETWKSIKERVGKGGRGKGGNKSLKSKPVPEGPGAGRFALRGLVRNVAWLAAAYVGVRAAIGALGGFIISKLIGGSTADALKGAAFGAASGGWEGLKSLLPGSWGQVGTFVAMTGLAVGLTMFAPATAFAIGVAAFVVPVGMAIYQDPVMRGLGKAAVSRDGWVAAGVISATPEQRRAAQDRVLAGMMPTAPQPEVAGDKAMKMADYAGAALDPFGGSIGADAGKLAQNGAANAASAPQHPHATFGDLKTTQAAMTGGRGDPMIDQITGKAPLNPPTLTPQSPKTDGKGYGLINQELAQITMEPRPDGIKSHKDLEGRAKHMSLSMLPTLRNDH